jgi:hypothetical protein
MSKKKVKVLNCPFCGSPAKLVTGAELYGVTGKDFSDKKFWDCRPCDAYVGVHKDSPVFRPLGSLVNKNTREWCKRAHATFDPFWSTPENGIKRIQAYLILSTLMGIPEERTHIGMMNAEECRQVVELFKNKTVVQILTDYQSKIGKK